MSQTISKGGNTASPADRVTTTVSGLGPADSVVAFLVTADGAVRHDGDFVFFNNPAVPGVSLDGQRVTVDLTDLPADVDRVVVAAVRDDGDPAPLAGQDLQVRIDPDDLMLPVTGLTCERAVVLVEFYRRAGSWKLRNISAGWTEGFAALVRAHGVQVDEDSTAGTADAPGVPAPAALAPPAPQPPPAAVLPMLQPPPAPTLSLRKPGVDAVDLGTRTGRISLTKGQQVTIAKSPRLVATCSWPRDTDYDILALVRYRDGHTETVSTFGTREAPKDHRSATADGLVRHAGDVGRDGGRPPRKRGLFRAATSAAAPEVGHESIEITLGPEVLAVAPVVYSAQSNGTGSFRRYRVGMSLDNGEGDTVTIAAADASDNDAIFTCVPGIVINDPDGARIQYLELYSAPGSEARPVIGPDLVVRMDAGPINAYK